MKVLPGFDLKDEADDMNFTQSLILAIYMYIKIILYTILLCFELLNVYRFLYLRKKYKVLSLSLFYALSIPCTILRLIGAIWDRVLTVQDILWINLPPGELKIGIALA